MYLVFVFFQKDSMEINMDLNPTVWSKEKNRTELFCFSMNINLKENLHKTSHSMTNIPEKENIIMKESEKESAVVIFKKISYRIKI